MVNELPVQPIKRKDALVRFSHEHHFALLLVWKIRQGIKNNITQGRISDFILFFFDNDLQKHFENEEKDLFPKLGKGSPLRDRALQEHQAINGLINEFRSGKQNYDLLNEFAVTLDKHIRFEERTLFNHLQDILSDKEMLDLAHKHSAKSCDITEKWKDKFWIK